MKELFTKPRVIAIVIITLLLSVLTIINMIGGNKNEYTINGSNTSSDTSSSTNGSTNIKTSTTSTTSETTNTTKTSKTTKRKTTRKTETQVAGTYTLTHYGWDCKGCGGSTASGYNVRNTIYYKDPTYGSLRIVAMRNIPLYSVIKIKNYDGQDIMAIVLDRCKSGSIVDLLVPNESTASKLGIRSNIEIEIIRSGE
jgi:3D (Asp-Asp-Asp) domain-containing protein